jgi:hypothetical protein
LRRIVRGRPQLRKLRELMEEVYRMFDRRCRMATALAELAASREKTVYRVWTRKAIEGRLAPDLRRESEARGRAGTTQALHEARAA